MMKTLESSLYHSVLRIAVCVMALVLIFDSGLLSETTAKLSNNTQDYLASAVGVRVGVAPTDVNVLTAKITQLEHELQARDREINVGLNDSGGPMGMDSSTFILSLILFILLLLIVMNYALDYARSRPVITARSSKSTA